MTELLLFAGGLAAGALGGLLGIGGGIVLMPLLRFVVDLSPPYAAGTCILAVFFTTLGGSYYHLRHGNLNLRSVVPLIVSGSLACVLFSFLFQYLARNDHWLDLGIGLVFCVISARMIADGIPARRKRDEEKQGESGEKVVHGTLTQKMVIGASAGGLPGLLGIGTGSILVPAFTYLLRIPVKTAMAASLVCFSFNAAISSAFKAAQGYVVLDVALLLCLGTLIGAPLGAGLNRRFSSGTVKTIFGLVFLYVALKFLLSFLGVTI